MATPVTSKVVVCGTVALVLNAVFAWGAVEATAYLPPERGVAVQQIAQSQHATPTSQQRRMAAL
jgi:hypothetical protein